MTKLVIFDLDGTLLNTIDDLAAACNHALRECGCPERRPEEYNMMVGRGIYNLFRAALPEGQKTDEMVELTPETRELFERWVLLTREQKNSILEIMRLFKTPILYGTVSDDML